jgi:uncharacterized protein (TIGR03067 family)
MLNVVAVVVLGALVGAPLHPGGDPAAKDRALLAGTWVLESATCAGQPLPLGGPGRTATAVSTWVFEGDTFRATISGPAREEGTFRVDPGKSPKHLDLLPPAGAAGGPRKCLYAIDGDDLTVALSVVLGPGAEAAADRAAAAAAVRATRPAAVGGRGDAPTLTLTFKRQKR